MDHAREGFIRDLWCRQGQYLWNPKINVMGAPMTLNRCSFRLKWVTAFDGSESSAIMCEGLILNQPVQ